MNEHVRDRKTKMENGLQTYKRVAIVGAAPGYGGASRSAKIRGDDPERDRFPQRKAGMTVFQGSRK